MGDSAWGSGGGTYQVVVVVVGRCAREMRGGEGDWAKTQNRAIEARFWARHVEWRWGKVRGGGTMAHTRRQRQWGRAVAKHEEGRGVRVKNSKPSHSGLVSGCNGAAEGGGGCCGVTAPSPVLTYEWGWGVRWYGEGGWWFGCAHLAPLLLLLLFSTHSLPFSTHSLPSLQPTDGLCGRRLRSVAWV
jgi:hypothetical protein